MKILIMPSWYAGKHDEVPVGGIFHYEQAIELSKKCEVAIYYPFDRTLDSEMSAEIERGLLTYRSYFMQKQRFLNIVRMIRTFCRINKEFQPDIIHAHVATEVGRYAVVLAKIFKKPLIVTEHSTMECSGVAKGIGKIYGRMVYSQSKYNVCVSQNLQYKLQSVFPKYRFETIYDGITMPKVKSASNKYRKEGKTNIVLVAVLYSPDIKGIQFALPAIHKLIEEGEKIAFHIVGDGEYKEYYEKMAADCGIAEDCIFHGSCSKQKVFEIVNEMDFLLSASLLESFGCSLAEAMMLGKPVVATRSGGPESFVNDKVGILVDKGSETAIANGLREMIHKFSMYDADAIRQYAYDNFEMANVCNRYLKLYKTITNNRRKK